MALRDSEFDELCMLLVQARSGTLTARGEQELRFLLSKGNPKTSFKSLEDLVETGRMVVGIHELMRLARAETAAATA